ncbi:Fic family protein [Desulfobacula phenolica]|uniref:Fic/DOC family protein n=1 Tax=Desulfobacula phenolica TaxID=90732 RepID=A0A1H2FJN5_9BACT|nr:Fic family protein [Desulfobacula phenolica]SDU07489.1 Fic/DOC family protein [Desulfobacula phenolica]
MSRVMPAEELDLIERVILNHPEGIGISLLESVLANHLSQALTRRTLQRRLSRLLADKRIITKGKGIALVYKPSPGVSLASVQVAVEPSIRDGLEEYVPVSPEGAIIRDLVQQPLMRRKPVGYHRSFLEDYEPGVTFYLSETLRTQFHEMGRTPTGGHPAGTYAREILNRLLIDLSWASSLLEGNTYNRLDTLNLIEFGQAAEGKDIRETQMILNHKAAIEMLIESADQIGFNPFTFLNLHAILSDNLLPNEDACGRLRRRPVSISGSVFHPLAMPQVLEECFYLVLLKASAISDPFEQAFFIMVQLPYLQPFEDVNKRVSRLGANIPLIRHNLCPLSFVDVPEQAYTEGTLAVYEFNQIDLLRDVFVWAYERSCQRYLAITQTMAEPDPLRIRYREALILTVRKIVLECRVPSINNIEQIVDDKVSENDREAFGKIVHDSLQRMHEGSVARYRLKLSQFQLWKPIRDRYIQDT